MVRGTGEDWGLGGGGRGHLVDVALRPALGRRRHRGGAAQVSRPLPPSSADRCSRRGGACARGICKPSLLALLLPRARAQSGAAWRGQRAAAAPARCAETGGLHLKLPRRRGRRRHARVAVSRQGPLRFDGAGEASIARTRSVAGRGIQRPRRPHCRVVWTRRMDARVRAAEEASAVGAQGARTRHGRDGKQGAAKGPPPISRRAWRPTGRPRGESEGAAGGVCIQHTRQGGEGGAARGWDSPRSRDVRSGTGVVFRQSRKWKGALSHFTPSCPLARALRAPPNPPAPSPPPSL